ncbi:MAG: DNA gyrase subunit B, partial [Thermoanaerobaculia bacterium]
IDLLLDFGFQEGSYFLNEDLLKPLCKALKEHFQEVETIPDPDNGWMILIKENGVLGHSYILKQEIIESSEYSKLLSLYRKIKDLLNLSFIIGEEQYSSLDEMVSAVLEKVKKGYSIQRYKGLGEMNPEQLWETTMDPERRVLLKVTIEDAVEADRIFSVLMGDQVEPRKSFIMENALRVKNLDV